MLANGHLQSLHSYLITQVAEFLSSVAFTAGDLPSPERRDNTVSNEQIMSFSPPRMGNSAVGMVSMCALMLFCKLAPSHANHESEEKLPHATEPGSQAPQLVVPEYRSPLSTYQPFEDADPLDWKEANDRVGEIGGWRVYSREAFESDDADDTDSDSK